jgi:hypothetical protein
MLNGSQRKQKEIPALNILRTQQDDMNGYEHATPAIAARAMAV